MPYKQKIGIKNLMKKSIRISTDQYPNKKVDILRTVFVKINNVPVMRQLIAPLEMNRKRILLTTLRNQRGNY